MAAYPYQLDSVTGVASGELWITSGALASIVHLRRDGFLERLSVGDPPEVDTYFVRVFAPAADDVWVISARGKLHHFDGQGWTTEDTAAGAILFDVWGRRGDGLWLVGEGGAVLRRPWP